MKNSTMIIIALLVCSTISWCAWIGYKVEVKEQAAAFKVEKLRYQKEEAEKKALIALVDKAALFD